MNAEVISILSKPQQDGDQGSDNSSRGIRSDIQNNGSVNAQTTADLAKPNTEDNLRQ